MNKGGCVAALILYREKVMGISFNFFDKAVAEMEEIEKLVAEENAAMTEEEKKAEEEKTKAEFEKILQKAELNIAKKQKQIDKKKMEEFRRLSKMAVGVAQIFELNVDIHDSSNGLYGIIAFKADSVMLVKDAPELAKKSFAALVAAATETIISQKQDLIEIQLSYDFY